MIKQLYCKQERRTTFPRQEEITTEGDLDKTWGFFKDVQKISDFFTWGFQKMSLQTNNERNGRSVSACISMHALLVCGCLIVHAALFGSRIEASANSATRFCIHSWNVCLTHSVWFRCHSLMVVRCLTCRSIENFGAIFSCNVVLGFHPCSARVPEGTVFIFTSWMPSPCEGVRLLRSTRRLRRSAIADLSRSSVSSTTRGSLAGRAPSCTTKWLQNVGFFPPQWPRWSGSSSVWSRRVWRDVERATCSRPELFTMCHHTWSFVAATDQTRSSSSSTKSTTWSGPISSRAGMDCRASSSPEKAGRVTGLLRHAGTKGNGHHGGFPRQIVEAWHVQRRHELQSGASDNMKYHRFCILTGSAQFQSVRGHLEALQCCGVDVVGATCHLSARKPLRAWAELRAKGFLSPSSRYRRTPSTPSMPVFFVRKSIVLFFEHIWNTNLFFQEKPLF